MPALRFHVFQQTPDPRPRPPRPAWWVQDAQPMAFDGAAWFLAQALVAAAPQPPPDVGAGPALVSRALETLPPDFSGELLFLPAPLAEAFAQLLQELVPAFLEGRATVAWQGRDWPIDPFNPDTPAGHAVAWCRTARGLWAMSAEAAPGAMVLGTALDVFGQVHPVEGTLLDGHLDPPVFDDTRACLLHAPALLGLLALPPARKSPALAAFLEAGLADGALGWPVVLARGPIEASANPLAGAPVAFPEPCADAPGRFDEWVVRWGAHPRLPGAPGVRRLGEPGWTAAELWAKALATAAPVDPEGA